MIVALFLLDQVDIKPVKQIAEGGQCALSAIGVERSRHFEGPVDGIPLGRCTEGTLGSAEHLVVDVHNGSAHAYSVHA